jgi:ATP-dependent DNA helicase RecQ
MAKSICYLLTSPSDIIQAENQFINILPDKSFEPHVSSFATTFKLHTEKASTSSSPSICIILFKIWVSNFKTYNAMQFLDRQGIINLSQEFSEKKSAISYSFQRSDRYMSLNPNDEEIILAILRVS